MFFRSVFFLKVFFRRVFFLRTSVLLIPSSNVGAVATLAFLVVFRVLIKLFFSIDIVIHSLLVRILSSGDACEESRPSAKRIAVRSLKKDIENKRLSAKVLLA